MRSAFYDFIRNSLLIIGVIVVGQVWLILLHIIPFTTKSDVCIEAKAKGYNLEQCKDKP